MRTSLNKCLRTKAFTSGILVYELKQIVTLEQLLDEPNPLTSEVVWSVNHCIGVEWFK